MWTAAAAVFLVAVGGSGVIAPQPALAQTGGFNFNQPQDWVTGLDAPWDMAFLPGGGDLLITQRDSAQVVRVNPNSGAPSQPPVNIPNVSPGGEGGLLGLAIHPNYAQNGWVYVYHTSPSDNRIVRFQLGTSGTPQNLQSVLTGIPRGAVVHNGGRIRFGPDGMLYAATGDAGQTANAQDQQSLAGKILRMTDTGGVPSGNPFGSLVYSYGHRNVQGLAFDSAGRLWASEFGANSQDEVNLIQAGGNYGWPTCEGPCNNPNFINPLHAWSTAEASPSGAAIANNTLFVAGLRGQRLWLVPLSGTSIGTPTAQLQGQYGRLRAVTVGPDGALYVMTNNTDGRGTPQQGDDRIVRFPGSGTQPPPPPSPSPPPPSPPPPSPPPPSPSPSPPPPGPGGCTADATVQTQWGGGYVVQPATVTNTSSSAISGWTVTFTLPSGHSVAGSWNAQFSTSGQTVTATNMPYNGSLSAGGSTSFGFQVSRPGGDSQTPGSYGCTAG